MMVMLAVGLTSLLYLRWQWAACCQEFSVAERINRRQQIRVYSGVVASLLLALALPANAMQQMALSLFLVQLWLLMCFDGWYGYLPDKLSYTLLWSGLLWCAYDTPWVLSDRVWGAALGYGLPWAVGTVFALLRGKEGLGRGDAKFLAGIGAWLGVLAVPYVLFVASALALCYAVLQRCRTASWPTMLYFGPFLGLAAGMMLMVQYWR
ncbi:prepilin peptidase [Paenalcaligenes sp. Me131]|uniref:prepilin peptidase n=1 Tax=Paenalcaligenes sp. Me131 TaxID=3392636 RepID=UPI003D294261